MKILTKLFFWLVLTSFTILPIQNTFAQQTPTLHAIATKVLRATIPNRSYTVTINQTINAHNKTKTKQAIASGLFKKTIQFNAKFDLRVGLKAQKVIDNNKIKIARTENQKKVITGSKIIYSII